ncbi:MAG TPA: class I SAM-dependent methyltransferase [Phycisphaerae bacterium]|nr:class I SAM-dependent methyltransferase [Phycisphaerae bacterium]HOB76031.1 class I SAM-dependent methyltransferase [Phycisphaerae bacterium]HOJ53468.1 class I SAM-dependent methyltransferase [Phycisphaerae bacterium]HOL25375.1 class I SAM-dependent methyltransferase [Phycisphaerae bacterium]HPP21879.1 class I SAM-dependent methyltransferase [Phycisphaerae bacterium]
MQSLTRESACLVCGCSHMTPHLEILQRCSGCGFVTARLDAPVDVRQIYEGRYFTGEEYLDYLADEPFFRKNFRKRLRELLRRCSGGRLLEIGAAYGFFLDMAREHFDVVGYEINPEAVRHAREVLGVDVRTDDFLTAGVEDLGGPVDMTVMWDVIEHLERPDLFLAHIAEVSRPGALIYITTGDIGSALARRRGRRWRMIHPPSHLHYFDRRTLPQLLARYGFGTLEVRSVGVARSFRQVLYSILVLGLQRPRAYEALKKFVPPAWGFTLNTFDIMQVVARYEGTGSPPRSPGA